MSMPLWYLLAPPPVSRGPKGDVTAPPGKGGIAAAREVGIRSAITIRSMLHILSLIGYLIFNSDSLVAF